MIIIRPGTHDDIPVLSRLWADLVLEENPDAKPDRVAWAKMQSGLIGRDNYTMALAVVDGKIVGYANGLFTIDMVTGVPFMQGGNLFILPEYRKGEAGRRLHRASLEDSKLMGCQFMRRKVSATNKRMVRRMKKGIESKRFKIKEYIVDETLNGGQNHER